ncbi:MAG: aminotransferase class V-fold PLP-dependent enzyme [Clostridia bacterium]|nr:aminotransferase class V-fold PLP-dependent enzyme [Clostridia bacterium]
MNYYNNNFVYLDNAATSFHKPKEVKDAVINALNFYTANPGRSGHKLSQNVAEIVYDTRENLKEFFGAKSYDLIFTKNCTEALNLAIFGTLKKGDHVITTCYEHNSVLRPLEHLKMSGVEVTILCCDLQNFHEQFEEKIQHNTKLVITTFVSNVTGEICDVKAVNKICKKHNIKHLVDGAQASGHMKINLENLGCDMFAFAGHKGLLSLTGVGGLFVKNLEDLFPIIYGGTGTDSKNLIQPTDTIEGFEAGTISTISIISLNAGVKFLKQNFSKILEIERNLSENLYEKLKKLKFLTLFSKETSQNVFSFNIKNLDSGTVANLLNEKFKICVRAGLHCAPLIHKKNNTSDVGAVRVSLDFYNSQKEIDYLIYALTQIANA